MLVEETGLYKTRDGRVMKVNRILDHGAYPIHGTLLNHPLGHIYTFTLAGRWLWDGEGIEDGKDLVEFIGPVEK